MGGGGKGSSQQQSSFQPPPWALAGGQQSVETAQQLSQTPFEIPVQPIAGLAPQQQEAMQTVEHVQGMTNPFFEGATALDVAGARPDIAQYFGAESAGVVPELKNIFGQQMSQATGNWQQQAGGVGADRIAVAQGQLANQQGLAAGQTLSDIMKNAVSQSQAGAGLEQQAGMNLAQLGKGSQEATLQGATAELQAGTLAQQQLQNQQNAAYENILQQISWPFQTNQYLGSMSAGVTPAMGGMGLTSGNTKSSMMNTSGVGKGMGALGGKMGQGGGVPFIESPNTVPDDISSYDTGGRVDPLQVAMGHQEPLTAGGPSAFQDGGSPSLDSLFLHGANGERIPDMSGGILARFQQGQGGGESPATGRTIQVPYGPAFGGPQPLTLTGGAGQPPPNIHAGDFHFPTQAQGTENLDLKGATHGAFQDDSKGTPFDGVLKGLLKERSDLMGMMGGAAGSPGGMPGWMSSLPSAGWAGHASGGGVDRPSEIGSVIFGETTGGPPSVGRHKEQKDTAGTEVGNLLGSDSQNPAKGHTVIPRTTAQGRPSSSMQWLMTNRQPPPPSEKDIMGAGQYKGQASNNPFGDPAYGGHNYIGETPGITGNEAAAAARAGVESGLSFDPKTGNVGTPDTLKGKTEPPPPPADAAALPTDMSVADLGFGDDSFVASGGAVGWPVHMQDGGDTMPEPATPFTPEGEITNQKRFDTASKIYNQPNQQTAGLTLSPDMQGEKPAPSTPFDPMSGAQLPGAQSPPSGMGGPGSPALPQPYPGTQLPGAIGQQPTGFKPPFEMTNPFRPGAGQPSNRPTQPAPSPFEQTAPTPPTTPLTSDKDREQQGVTGLLKKAAEPAGTPAVPTPQPRPPGATAPPGGTPSPPPSTPPPSAAGAASPAATLLNQPMSEIVKQFGLPSVVPDQHLNGRQWLEKHPEYRDKVIALAEQHGINLRQALQLPPTGAAAKAPTLAQPGRNADAQAIIDSAGRLKMDPRMWAAMISYESRFNPTNVNTSGKGYPVHGLIGFDPENVQKYGMPAKTIAEQLPQIEKYMLDRGWKPGVHAPDDLARAYSIINAGSLDARGNPRWAARDINGNLSEHVARITNREYANGDKFLYGKEGAPPEVSRETDRAAAASKDFKWPESGTPAAPSAADVEANLRSRYLPSKTNLFLRELAYGPAGVDLAMRQKAQELGLFKQASEWEELRNVQYGSMTPQMAGAATLDEAHATRKLLGATAGSAEESGEHGSVTHAAATGKSPAGAKVSPVGGEPSGSAAAPAGAPSTPAGAPSPGISASTAGSGLDPALQRAVSSPNMAVRSQGIANLGNLAKAGNIEADTVLKRMEAARLGWQGQPIGNAIIYPLQGKALVPGRGFVPMEEIFGGAPGAAAPPTGAGAAPSSPFAPAPGAASTSPPAASPAAPLPSGAGPELMPKPAASAPAAAPAPSMNGRLQDDPAFARNPITRSAGFDWMADKAEVVKEIAAAHQAAQSTQENQTLIENVKRDAEKIAKNPALLPGWIFSERVNIARALNTALQAFGAPPIVNPDDLSSAQGIEKLQTQLATLQVKGMGREPGYILQMLKSSMIPGGQMTIGGIHNVLGTMESMNRRALDYSVEKENYASNNGTLRGFEEGFSQVNPPEKYNRMAESMGARDDKQRPINPAIVHWLRQDPSRAPVFDQTFHTPGLANFYLSGAP